MSEPFMAALLKCRIRPRGRRYFGLKGADGGDPDDCLAGLVRAGEVDLGGESPVVVAGRIVKDLPHPPYVGVSVIDDQHRRPPGVRARADLLMLVEIRFERTCPRVGVPTGLLVELAEFLPPAQRCQLDPP